MLSTKLASFSRTKRYLTTSNVFINHSNLRNRNYTHLISSHSLKCKQNVYTCLWCKCYKPNITSPSISRYSTNPIVIPPIPPPKEADVFGTIGGLKYEKVELSEDELKEEERLKELGGRVPRKLKHSTGEYAKMIKNYIEKGDLEAAEQMMIQCKKNKDRPTPFMYTLLMRGFAMHGDVKNCYKYYAEMKNKQYKIKANTYTSLFNACANSGDSDRALRYLDKVKDYMIKQKEPMNHAHYNVLVKAYGRHSQYDEALKVFQEMLDKKLKIGITTLNSLMYAANSNVESGLKDILHTWQLMRKLKVPPDMFTYNLLLRAIRDTHFGDCSIKQVFLSDESYPAIITDDNRPDLLLYPPVISSLPLENIHKKVPEKLLLSAPESESVNNTDSTEPVNNSDSLKPVDKNELISSNKTVNFIPDSINNLDLDAIMKQNKLILFGGVEGIIKKMENDKVRPNIKTVTYLMELVPDSTAAEAKIINYARSKEITLDIDFFNMLIKKRCLRGAHAEAKEVLDYIHQADLRPNIVTYGVLALAVKHPKEIIEFLNAMRSTGHTINKYIADALLKNAFMQRNFGSILYIMELIKKEQVRLDETTFEKLDLFKQKMSEYATRKHNIAQSDAFKAGFAKFNLRYKTWQTEMGRMVMTERVSKKK